MAKLNRPNDEPPKATPRIPVIRGAAEEDPAADVQDGVGQAFILLWTRGDYYATTTGKVLPRLIPQRLENGLGGVRQLRDGSYDLSGLADDCRQARKRLIDNSKHFYCVAADDFPGRYRPAWGQIRDGVMVESVTEYEAWLEALYASGEIPRPTPEQLERLGDRYDALVAIDEAKGGHSRQRNAYAAMRDATRPAEAA